MFISYFPLCLPLCAHLHLGAPPPQYFWSKNGVPLGNNSGFEVHLSGELKIGTVAVTHNGLYTCIAVNRIGEREIGSVEATSRLFAIGMLSNS